MNTQYIKRTVRETEDSKVSKTRHHRNKKYDVRTYLKN